MGLLDWLGRRGQTAAPRDWQVRVDGDEVLVEDGRRSYHFTLGGARFVRVVPLGVGQHGGSSASPGWQVAIRKDDGDVPIGQPFGAWQHARDLAQHLCSATNLSLDEMTERMFSRVGSFTPKDPPPAPPGG
jgi:hypothetical protein